MTDNITIKIPAAKLKAAEVFAGKKDVRYYINGVLIESSAGVLRIVASNGTAMLVQRLDVDACQTSLFDFQVIMPIAMLGAIKKTRRDLDSIIPVILDPTHQKTTDITMLLPDNATITGSAIDGRYPNWRNVIPDTVADQDNVRPQQIRADIMAQIYLARKILACREPECIRMFYNTDVYRGMITDVGPDAIALAMPWGLAENKSDTSTADMVARLSRVTARIN